MKEKTPIFAAELEKGPKKYLVYLFLILVLVFFAFPIFWLLETAFKNQIDFVSIPPKIFFKPTLENFRQVLTKRDFGTAYKNSLIISSAAIILSTIIGVPAAYGLNRFRFRGRAALSFYILTTRFFPPVVVVIPFFQIFSKLKLTNTLFAMIMIYLVATLPLVIWVMVGFFQEIPFELEESACIDGASPIQIFTKIALPLVKPGVVAVVILGLVGAWNELLYATILTGQETRTLPVAIYSFVSYEQIAWGNLCAASILAIAPVVIFTIFFQKYLVAGLTFGAVKG